MRRVVSLYLPTWPTDRIRRRYGGRPGRAADHGRQGGLARLVAAVDARRTASACAQGSPSPMPRPWCRAFMWSRRTPRRTRPLSRSSPAGDRLLAPGGAEPAGRRVDRHRGRDASLRRGEIDRRPHGPACAPGRGRDGGRGGAPGCAWRRPLRQGRRWRRALRRCGREPPIQRCCPRLPSTRSTGLGSNASASSPWRGPRWCAASARTRRFASTRRSAMPSNPSIPSCRGDPHPAGRLRGADRPAGGHQRHRRTPRPKPLPRSGERGEESAGWTSSCSGSITRASACASAPPGPPAS